MKIELRMYRREEGFGALGLFNSRNTRNERESDQESYPDAADVAGEKASENIQQEDRGPLRIMADGFLNMRDFAVDTVMGKVERAQENKRLYQEEYRKHEKQAIKKQARDDAYGRNQGDDQGSQGFLQNLAMGLNNTGNAFAQEPPAREERSPKKEDRRGREKSEDRRRRDDWGQLF